MLRTLLESSTLGGQGAYKRVNGEPLWFACEDLFRSSLIRDMRLFADSLQERVPTGVGVQDRALR